MRRLEDQIDASISTSRAHHPFSQPRKLFTFTRFRRANGNRSNLERDRAIAPGVQAPDQAQTVLPCADTAAMLFWAIGERLTAYWAD